MSGVISSLIILVGLVSAKPEKCEWVKAIPKSILQFSNKTVELAPNGEDASLIKCSSLSHYLLVEVDLGEAGTSSKVREIQLIAYDISGKKISEYSRKTVKKVIREVVDQKNGEIEEFVSENPYRLEKSKSGDAQIYFVKSKERVSLK